MQTGIVPEFILFFDCPEEEMERRLLGRNQVRHDLLFSEGYECFLNQYDIYVQTSV